METIKAKDYYRIETIDVIGQGQLIALMLLYQPIMGYQSTNIYLTLYSEKRHLNSFENLSRLLLLMNMDAQTFMQGIKKLEEMSLVRTYYNEGNSRYIFSLLSPLNTEQFFKSDVYSRLLLRVLGSKEYENNLKKLQRSEIDKTNFKDVSHGFDCRLIENWDEEKELEFIKIKPQLKFENDTKLITFDYDRFLQITNKMLFPLESRTNENLKMIGEYATVYGLSPETMRTIIAKCTDPFSSKLDTTKLRSYAKSAKPDEKKVKNPYLLSCISFLQSKQNGAEVPEYEKGLLEHLLMKMQLTPEVINVLVEYALEKNNNRLNKNFVDSIASALKRSNVTTYEQALKLLNETHPEHSKNKKTTTYKLPDYTATNDVKAISDDELKELDDWLKGKSS